MQTTLTIDDDVLAAAEEIAAGQRKSVGEVISQLTRRALVPVVPPFIIRDGIPILNLRSSTPVTMELVNRLRDELP